jgi:hypothetical protein
MIATDILDPPDACPSCDPGEHPATAPLSVEDAGGDILASYQAECGTAWQTRFDEYGWPVERMAAPVAERRAAA